MARNPLRVLLVEDSEDFPQWLLRVLRHGGYEPLFHSVHTREALENALRGGEWDIAIVDRSVTGLAALAAISLVKAIGNGLPVVVVSAQPGEELAVEAIRAGAHDYVTKSNIFRIIPAIERELTASKPRRDPATVQALAEEALEQTAVLDATVASIAGAVVVLDVDGTIRRASPAAVGLLGLDPDHGQDLHGERLAEFRCETHDGRALAPHETPGCRALRDETVMGELLVLSRRDGKTVWVAASAAPIKAADGRTLGAVATFTDVTAMRRLQEYQEDLVRTISHDLRSPLTAILGHGHILYKSLTRGKINLRRRESADAIILAARQMNAMIRNLVDSARMEAGKLDLIRSEVWLPGLVLDIKARLASIVDTERISITADDGLPPVLADPDRVERIVTNLLTNALKYSDPSTKVSIGISLDGNQVVTSVADWGDGISPAEASRLFQRYGRTERSRWRRDSVGLGLYITKGLVEAHGGVIWVKSEVGRGSTFYFSLPAAGRE